MTRSDAPNPQKPTFEQAVEQLEQIIEKIESGEVGLEETLAAYEQGTKLVAHCRKVLDAAEKKIRELTVEPDGTLSERDEE